MAFTLLYFNSPHDPIIRPSRLSPIRSVWSLPNWFRRPFCHQSVLVPFGCRLHPVTVSSLFCRFRLVLIGWQLRPIPGCRLHPVDGCRFRPVASSIRSLVPGFIASSVRSLAPSNLRSLAPSSLQMSAPSGHRFPASLQVLSGRWLLPVSGCRLRPVADRF